MHWQGKRLNGELVTSVELDGLMTKDYPDFCDAFITAAQIGRRDATEAELDALNEDGEFVNECAHQYFQ